MQRLIYGWNQEKKKIKSLINESCRNSRNSNDTDMKFGPVNKLGKRNSTTPKKFDDVFKSVNCDIIVIFWIYGQFEASRKPDSGRIVCKTNIFINSNLLFTKFEKRTQKFLAQLSCYCFLQNKNNKC